MKKLRLKCKVKRKIFTILGTIVLFLVAVFVVPIVINYLYSRPAKFSIFAMSWEASDALSFYGNILGSAATIAAVVLTIKFTLKNQKMERKLSIRPLLQTSSVMITSDNLDEIPEDVIYIDDNVNICSSSSVKPDELHPLCSDSQKFFSDHYVMNYTIENCGAGAALEIVWTQNGSQLIRQFCIRSGQCKSFVLMLNRDFLRDQRFYFRFKFIFMDACSIGKYMQEETFCLFTDKYGKLNLSQVGDEALSNSVEI